MHYKTIALGLIEEQPELHERLRQSRTLLATMNQLANELKTSHETWKEHLLLSKPDSDPIQIASEALEIACQMLQDHLASGSPPNETEAFPLDEAMASLRRHTPTA